MLARHQERLACRRKTPRMPPALQELHNRKLQGQRGLVFGLDDLDGNEEELVGMNAVWMCPQGS